MSFSIDAPLRGPKRGRSFTGDFKRKMRFCFIKGPRLSENPSDS